VIVVGRAAEVVPMLAPLGEVEVLDTNGAPVVVKPTPAAAPAAQPSASAL